MPFGVAAAAVGAAGSIAGSMLSSSSASSSAAAANQEQQREFDVAQQNLQPYTQAGTASLGQQQNLLGLNGQAAANQAMQSFQSSPGYGYQVQQGLRAVDAGAAAQGMVRSGATLRAEQTLGANLANQDFSNYYNRLAGISQLGQASAANTASAAITTGQGIASTDTSLGGLQASVYSGLGNNLANVGTNYLRNSGYQSQLSGYGGAGGSDPFAGAGYDPGSSTVDAFAV